jgi:hypothetical protein
MNSQEQVPLQLGIHSEEALEEAKDPLKIVVEQVPLEEEAEDRVKAAVEEVAVVTLADHSEEAIIQPEQDHEERIPQEEVLPTMSDEEQRQARLERRNRRQGCLGLCLGLCCILYVLFIIIGSSMVYF